MGPKSLGNKICVALDWVPGLSLSAALFTGSPVSTAQSSEVIPTTFYLLKLIVPRPLALFLGDVSYHLERSAG